MSEVPEIDGPCDARFAGVRRTLEENFSERGELGAAVAVILEGRFVVDIWGGWADEARTSPWGPDTLVNVFSVGKPMAALCVLILAERGQIDLDAPVACYWPEFAAHGKDIVTVRMLLAHRAGLPAIRRLLPDGAMYDWDLMTAALAAEEPWWAPGEQHGYHVNTFGFLAGELVRRVTHRNIGAFFRETVAGPLAADFFFGIGADHDRRIADFVFTDELLAGERGPQPDEARRLLLQRTYFNPPGLSGVGTVNTRAWRAAEMPSTNGHANARAAARIFGALACGGSFGGAQLLHPETITQATSEASVGPDAVLRRPSRFGLGFQLTHAESPLGPNSSSFGHFGAGGALAFADPEARLAFAYTMNRAGPRFRNPRVRALIDAVYAAL